MSACDVRLTTPYAGAVLSGFAVGIILAVILVWRVFDWR
jgi:tetrahydromethanopterin S-methyltransferase subunit F